MEVAMEVVIQVNQVGRSVVVVAVAMVEETEATAEAAGMGAVHTRCCSLVCMHWRKRRGKRCTSTHTHLLPRLCLSCIFQIHNRRMYQETHT